MAMAREDFDRIATVIRSDPGARDELRRLVLTDALLAVPDRMERVERTLERAAALQEQLVVGQQQLERRVANLEDAIAALVAAQLTTERALERMTAGIDRLADNQRRIDRHLSRLERRAGGLFEVSIKDRIRVELAVAGLEVSPVSRFELSRYVADRHGEQALQELSALIKQPDWHGIARGPKGAALVIVEASLAADGDDVDRLEIWSTAARRHGIPVIPFLLARDHGAFLPSADELDARGIARSIIDTDEAALPSPELGEIDL